jgi:membrane dipeptidase
MVASHTACDALNHHIRSKPDNLLRAIADTDGLVGICCIPSFLGGNGDIAAMLDHVQHAAKLIGTDHVAIGTDTASVSRHAEGEEKKLPQRGPSRPYWENFWPVNALSGKGNPLSLAWTNWPLFTVGLVQRGLRDADIQKILGGNVIRLARGVLNPGPDKSTNR